MNWPGFGTEETQYKAAAKSICFAGYPQHSGILRPHTGAGQAALPVMQPAYGTAKQGHAQVSLSAQAETVSTHAPHREKTATQHHKLPL